MKHPLFVIIILFAVASGICAADYGALIREQFNTESPDGETDLSSKTTLAPWFTLPVGSQGDFSLSAGISADWRQETMQYIPELFRLELSLRPLSRLAIRAGRISWEDPSLFTAKGYFDGASAAVDIGSVRLGGGIYYTGLLYKDTAKVKKTPGDTVDYGAELDYENFSDTYFAPRRLLGAVQGEFPGFIARRGTLHAGVLAQFDLSGAPDKLNSQYLLLRYVLDSSGAFDITLAGAAELIEAAGDLDWAFASSLEAGWSPPTALSDRFSAGFRWASGKGSATAAYFPVIAESQGSILKPDFSGIMTLRGAYQARFIPSLSAELGIRYFLRTDSETFSDSDLGEDSYFLGGEVFASALWVPLSDISFTLGGGAFFPQTGAAFRDGAPVRWLLSLGTIFSF